MLDELLKIGGFVLAAIATTYGVIKDIAARREGEKRRDADRKREAAEEKLRRYQTDPVVVPQGGAVPLPAGRIGIHPRWTSESLYRIVAALQLWR
jgi:hypothetical protein